MVENNNVNLRFQLLEDLIPQLICQWCQDVPSPTNYQRFRCSKSNHSICQDCKSYKKCPNPCDSKVLDQPCSLVKSMIEYLPWYCSNYKHGCRQIFEVTQELELHQSQCVYRLVNCLELGCHEKILFKNVVEHYQSSHVAGSKILELQSSNGIFVKFSRYEPQDLTGTYWLASKLVFTQPKLELESGLGSGFYLVGKIGQHGIFFWVYYLGSRSEAEQHCYSIWMMSESQEHFFKGRCHSLDQDSNAIIQQESAFMIGKQQLKAFLDDKNGFKIQLSLQKLKSEDQDHKDLESSGVSEYES